MSFPSVSAVVPNYNHAPYLERRLASVFGQTTADVEAVLLDDASTDASREILGRYASRPGVRLAFNETNSGSPFRQWNKGVRLARGAFVWIAESDDEADVGLLARLVPLLERNPAVGIAYCLSDVIDEDGRSVERPLERLDSVDPARWHSDFIMDGREFLRRYQVVMNCVPNASGVVFRKRVFEAAGGAVEDLRLAGDWMTWSRMMLHGDVAFVAEPLNRWRVHAGTVRSGWVTTQRFVLEYASVIRFICRSVTVAADAREMALAKLFARWRRVESGFTVAGILRLCTQVRAIGGARRLPAFLRVGLAGMVRTRPALRPLHAALKGGSSPS